MLFFNISYIQIVDIYLLGDTFVFYFIRYYLPMQFQRLKFVEFDILYYVVNFLKLFLLFVSLTFKYCILFIFLIYNMKFPGVHY